MIISVEDINNKLDKILEVLNKMVDSQTQLDSEIQAVGTVEAQLVTDLNAVIAKLQSVEAGQPAPDFSNEVNSLTAIASALQSADASAQAAVAPSSAPSS